MVLISLGSQSERADIASSRVIGGGGGAIVLDKDGAILVDKPPDGNASHESDLHEEQVDDSPPVAGTGNKNRWGKIGGASAYQYSGVSMADAIERTALYQERDGKDANGKPVSVKGGKVMGSGKFGKVMDGKEATSSGAKGPQHHAPDSESEKILVGSNDAVTASFLRWKGGKNAAKEEYRPQTDIKKTTERTDQQDVAGEEEQRILVKTISTGKEEQLSTSGGAGAGGQCAASSSHPTDRMEELPALGGGPDPIVAPPAGVSPIHPSKGGPPIHPSKGGPPSHPSERGPPSHPSEGGPLIHPSKGGPSIHPSKGGSLLNTSSVVERVPPQRRRRGSESSDEDEWQEELPSIGVVHGTPGAGITSNGNQGAPGMGMLTASTSNPSGPPQGTETAGVVAGGAAGAGENISPPSDKGAYSRGSPARGAQQSSKGPGGGGPRVQEGGRQENAGTSSSLVHHTTVKGGKGGRRGKRSEEEKRVERGKGSDFRKADVQDVVHGGSLAGDGGSWADGNWGSSACPRGWECRAGKQGGPLYITPEGWEYWGEEQDQHNHTPEGKTSSGRRNGRGIGEDYGTSWACEGAKRFEGGTVEKNEEVWSGQWANSRNEIEQRGKHFSEHQQRTTGGASCSAGQQQANDMAWYEFAARQQASKEIVQSGKQEQTCHETYEDMVLGAEASSFPGNCGYPESDFYLHGKHGVGGFEQSVSNKYGRTSTNRMIAKDGEQGGEYINRAQGGLMYDQFSFVLQNCCKIVVVVLSHTHKLLFGIDVLS